MQTDDPRPQVLGLFLLLPGDDPETASGLAKFQDPSNAAEAAETLTGEIRAEEIEIWEERAGPSGPKYRHICTCSSASQ